MPLSIKDQRSTQERRLPRRSSMLFVSVLSENSAKSRQSRL